MSDTNPFWLPGTPESFAKNQLTLDRKGFLPCKSTMSFSP